MQRFALAAAVFFGMASPVAAEGLRLPSIISDHMVLQQGKPIRLWGWADSGTKVSATLGGKSATGLTDTEGRWKLALPAMPAGGPHILIFNAGETVTINDVLIGEVWLGSGQSNMEFAMSNTHDAAKEIPAANHPLIRLFLLDRNTALRPEENALGSWKICNPENVKGFSGVAYHFGKNLQARLKTPVGMIASSWGGTPAEAWTPRAAMDADPVLASQAKKMSEDKAQAATWTHGLDFEIEIKDLRAIAVGGGSGKALAMPAKNWIHSEKPGSKVEMQAKDGGAKFSGNVKGGAWASVSVAPSGWKSTLDLSQAEAIEFKVRGSGKASMLLHQANVTDWDDYGSQAFELSSEWKTVRIELKSLKQGGWGAVRAFDPSKTEAINFSMQIPFWPDLPEVVYNGMIAPITSFTIKGVLWYQGESNAGRAEQYTSLLSAMIKSWRSAWGLGDFPFLIVQLPNWGQGGEAWVKMRAAQKQTLAVPGTGMIETMGLGDENDIHPRNKSEVGSRLAKLALKQVYKK